jgi:aspartokinase/homoserine dehydrogenase 1
VGLADVEPTHPAARLAGTDNLFALTTSRYRAQPLVIQGPGAGPEVTAQALLGDLLALRAS